MNIFIYLQSFVFRKLLYKEIVVINSHFDRRTYARVFYLNMKKEDISLLLEIDYRSLYIYIYIYIYIYKK